MNDFAIKERLTELHETLRSTAYVGLASASQDPKECQTEAPPRPATVDEAFDQLRLQMKYLLFDLEATRRENRYLRQMLETRPPTPPADEADGMEF